MQRFSTEETSTNTKNQLWVMEAGCSRVYVELNGVYKYMVSKNTYLLVLKKTLLVRNLELYFVYRI